MRSALFLAVLILVLGSWEPVKEVAGTGYEEVYSEPKSSGESYFRVEEAAENQGK